MKTFPNYNVFVAFVLSAIFISCSSQKKPVEAKSQPGISFRELKHDFDTIKCDTTVYHDYEFKNTGTTPIIILDVVKSCGCTTPSFSTKPVQPGQTDIIGLGFDSNGKEGRITKLVTVKTNIGDINLTFTAFVRPCN